MPHWNRRIGIKRKREYSAIQIGSHPPELSAFYGGSFSLLFAQVHRAGTHVSCMHTRTRDSILLGWAGSCLLLVPSLGHADNGPSLRLDSQTRVESSILVGADPDTGCPPSSKADATNAGPGPQVQSSSLCVQHVLTEALTASQRIETLPGLRLQANLRYGMLFGDAPRASSLTSYGSFGDLKVLGLTASWQSRRREWSIVLGRQSRWDADPLLFDGASVTWRHAAPNAQHSLSLTLFGGAWSDLATDVRAQAVYGAQLSQQVPLADAQGSSSPLDVATDQPATFGASVVWQPLWPLELSVADAYYLGLHHTRLGLRGEPSPTMTVYGEARALDTRPRDVRLGLSSVRFSGDSLDLQIRHVFEGEFPFSPVSVGVSPVGADRLLIGNPASQTQLRVDAWHPLRSSLLAGLQTSITLVDERNEQAYQRTLFELAILAHWQVAQRFYARAEVHQVLAPQAGEFSDAGELVLSDGEGDAFDINAFPNLSGEGEQSMLEASAQATAQFSPQVSLSVGGGLVWLQEAYTAFVKVENAVGGRGWLSTQWMPSPHFQAELRYEIEQELSASLYGWYTTAHNISAGVRARW